MLQWLMWLRGERAGAKHEAEQIPDAAKPREPRPTEEAVRDAKEQWQEDGERADQDYYHVPGAGNPDLSDPPMLGGKPLPKAKAKRGKVAAKPS